MKTNIVVELDEEQIVKLIQGHDIITELKTFAKEDDTRGGLFRKLSIDVICRSKGD
jgi:hypothetical protein